MIAADDAARHSHQPTLNPVGAQTEAVEQVQGDLEFKQLTAEQETDTLNCKCAWGLTCDPWMTAQRCRWQ